MKHDTILNPVYLTLKSDEYTNAMNATKSHLEFELYRPIQVNNNIDIFMTVESFKFANSIYNVSAFQNIFYFGLAPSYVPISVIIPKANYNVSSLIVMLNTLLTTYGMTFAFNSSTSKISIQNTSAYAVLVGSNCINKIIGFDENTGALCSAGITVAPNMANLIGTQMLYVAIPNLSINSYGVKSSSSHSVVSAIPITAIQGDTQVYYGSFHHKINDSVITKIEIIIKDEDENEVDFNSIEWFITIAFTMTYKKEYREPTQFGDVQDGGQISL